MVDDALLDEGTPHSYSGGPVTLWAGDKIDAVIGVGKNKSIFADDTQFSLVVTKVP